MGTVLKVLLVLTLTVLAGCQWATVTEFYEDTRPKTSVVSQGVTQSDESTHQREVTPCTRPAIP